MMNATESRRFVHRAIAALAVTVLACVTFATDARAQSSTLDYANQQVPYVLQGGLSLTTSVRVQKGASISVSSLGTMCFQGCISMAPTHQILASNAITAWPSGTATALAPNPLFPAPLAPPYSLLCGVQPFGAAAPATFGIPTLVAGTQWIECGRSPTTFHAPADGWLTFLENDNFPNDNMGSWSITSLKVTQPNYVNNLPPSEPPQVDQVEVVTGTVGQFGVQTEAIDYLGTYPVLPTAGSGGVRLLVHTPYNNTPRVDVDGVALQQNPTGSNPGYFASVANTSTDVISTPIAEWMLNIVPPAGKNTNSGGYTIGLTSLSNGNQVSPRSTVVLIQKSKAPPPIVQNQGGGASGGCGVPQVKTGYSYWSMPACPASASLGCRQAASGDPTYFCCNATPGATSVDCGQGFTEFPPTCPLSGPGGDPNMAFFNPGGCYVRNSN